MSLASLNRPLYSEELARLSGMSADTVRHYERRGLLPVAPRSATGYRLFPREALVRMQLIRAALSIGFSAATTHHFLLKTNGGAIRVEVDDPANADGRSSVRMHLTHIAGAFQKGDFDIPMFVHDTVPPGVPEMKRLRGNIRYSFDETPNRGQVVIFSTDKAALFAIHQFLRFQIEEHKTGDPTDIR